MGVWAGLLYWVGDADMGRHCTACTVLKPTYLAVQVHTRLVRTMCESRSMRKSSALAAFLVPKSRDTARLPDAFTATTRVSRAGALKLTFVWGGYMGLLQRREV